MAIKKTLNITHHLRFRAGCNGDPWRLEAMVHNPLEYLKWSGAQGMGLFRRDSWVVAGTMDGRSCYEHGLSAANSVLNHGPTRTHRSHGRM